jgi:hypothetical protein
MTKKSYYKKINSAYFMKTRNARAKMKQALQRKVKIIDVIEPLDTTYASGMEHFFKRMWMGMRIPSKYLDESGHYIGQKERNKK